MNSKQLAAVLVKVLGLSVIIGGIMSLASGMIQLSLTVGRGASWISMMTIPAHAIISVGIGLYLILQTSQVVGLLFQNGEE